MPRCRNRGVRECVLGTTNSMLVPAEGCRQLSVCVHASAALLHIPSCHPCCWLPACALQWDTADAAKTYPLADLALLPEDQLAGRDIGNRCTWLSLHSDGTKLTIGGTALKRQSMHTVLACSAF